MEKMPETPSEPYHCAICQYTTTHIGNYNKHLKSIRHNKMASGFTGIYECSYCDYQTTFKCHYDNHMASQLHENKKFMALQNLKPNQCPTCLHEYKSRASLWKHKKNCKPEDHPSNTPANESENNKTTANDDVINVLVKKSDELLNLVACQQTMFMSQQQQIITIVNTLATNGISNNTNNSHNTNLTNTNNSHNTTNNQTFNINYFLNEKCKNAVDIHDFIQNLDYSQESLKKNAHLTYPARITKQIREGLGNYNVEDRPIHCSDEKRKKIYIKHNGEWVTEYKFNDVVSKIGENNTGTFRQWAIENPNFRHLDTPEYEQYMNIYPGNIGPTSDEQEEKYSKKIIGGIIDEILIDKEKYAT